MSIAACTGAGDDTVGSVGELRARRGDAAASDAGDRDRDRHRDHERDDDDEDRDERCEHDDDRGHRDVECEARLLRRLERRALRDALAAAATAPPPDAVFVAAQVAQLDAMLAGQIDPTVRVKIRRGLLLTACAAVAATPGLSQAQILSTSAAVRTAFVMTPAATIDGSAAMMYAVTCQSPWLTGPPVLVAPPGNFKGPPACVPFHLQPANGDRALAAALAPAIARAHAAAPTPPPDLTIPNAVGIATPPLPLPGPPVAIDVRGGP